MADLKVTTDRHGSRTFGDHDDRWTRGGGSRGGRGGGYFRNNSRRFPRSRGGFRGGDRGYGSRRGGNFRSRGRDRNGPNPRTRLDDDGDEMMGEQNDGQSGNRRYNPYGRPSKGGYKGGRYDNNNGSGNSANTMRRLGLPIDSRGGGDSTWYKVTIPWGKAAGKDFIYNAIKSHMDYPFVPTHFQLHDNTASFFVNDSQVAETLRHLTKRISMPNGYKMNILVKKSFAPNIPLGENEIEKLKLCMSKRYDPVTKILKLNALHTDADLTAANLYMALARPAVMSNVVKIIEEHIPEVVGLDLSDNKINNLDHLTPLVSKTTDLKMLNIGKNRIIRLEEVQKLKDWNLDVLYLEGNIFCDKFNDQSIFVSSVRKIFPKVMKLDGNDLPPPITFDIEARTDLPKSKSNWFGTMDDNSKAILTRFLKDYFTVYDSDDRSALAGAYHTNASFSMTSSYNGTIQFKQQSLTNYIEESRNLNRISSKDTNKRLRRLKSGIQVVPMIASLPKTVHDPNSFMVDVMFMSPTMMSFIVQGIFKEVNTQTDKTVIRAFSRTFVTVPSGSSMAIMNDMLLVTNASPDQIQSAFKNPAPTPSSSPVPQTTPTDPFQGAGLTEIQQQMIVSFMADSHMNSEWSAKCLKENNWEYSRAGQVFLKLQEEGKIPPEAFVKN